MLARLSSIARRSLLAPLAGAGTRPFATARDKAKGKDKGQSPRVFMAGEGGKVEKKEVFVESMTPKVIVEKLDRYIIGQAKAKRAVAVSLRNRWRRQQLSDELKKEVLPMNILMKGATGTGKTEIARRLANLLEAPFTKVEATKYTEVGIVGGNAEDCVKDLVARAVKMERESRVQALEEKIELEVEEEILRRLPGSSTDRDSFREKLRAGEYDDTKIEVASFRRKRNDRHSLEQMLRGIGLVPDEPRVGAGSKTPASTEERVPVSEARDIIKQFHLDEQIDEEAVARTGLRRAEESGIIFLDEIDKLCTSERGHGYSGGPKGENVQKELLALVEGTTVKTDFGIVRTDHMLFVAAGAFHMSKPSDLLPELQGRLPIRVELEPLTEDDFFRILNNTEANLVDQQVALFNAEGVDLTFDESALRAIARVAKERNDEEDNIGARRLRAVIARVLEDVSFDAPDKRGEEITVDDAFVKKQMEALVQNEDLRRYII